MRSLALAFSKENLDEALQQVRTIEPSVVFLFAAPALFRDALFVQELKTKTADLKIIGCSTAGEIAMANIHSGGCSILAIHFDSTQVRLVKAPLRESKDSMASGEAMADLLKGPKLKSVIVFGPGTNVNGTALIDGLNHSLGRGVVISGGLAGDEAKFKETFTFINGEIYTDHAVGVGLYGDNVKVSCGSEGGWRPFGPARKVTRAEDNILYELDNKPALQLYKQYLGDKARLLPASGMSYPFAILRGDRTTSGLIRSALAIDSENEALILAGNIPEGARVCLMHADTAALVQGAAQAATEALRTHEGPEEEGCCLMVSCIGRRIVLSIDAEDELEAVADSFLPDTPVAGFYAYGEICSNKDRGSSELHNQTMTLTYITEAKGAA